MVATKSNFIMPERLVPQPGRELPLDTACLPAVWPCPMKLNRTNRRAAGAVAPATMGCAVSDDNAD